MACITQWWFLIPVGDHPIVVQFNDFSVGRHSLRVRFTTTGGQAEQDFNFDVPAEGNQCVHRCTII